ncbi:hypothetical protein DE4585_04546 [Mycobacteroides salmoniphilum]|uniref:Uncharacterized protein n=1 Tax=Mycobacteroides salmoniphilum TaxID=404941 RepID=A0A4R8RZG1_9MYCO|nr:hypothetical protein DE4585_04546 [Mycobacteroides salmoniphilum]
MLWTVVDKLVQAMPLTKDKAQTALGIDLKDVSQDQRSAVSQGGQVQLENGVTISDVRLVLRPAGSWDDGQIELNLTGTCVAISQAAAHYPNVKPLGPSTSHGGGAVFGGMQAWGHLRFEVSQTNPDCISSVTLAKRAYPFPEA